MSKVMISNVKFDILDLSDVSEIVADQELKAEKKGARICVLNSRVWHLARNDETYRNLVNSSNVTIADGFPLHKIIESVSGKKLPRVRGIDLFQRTLTNNVTARHLFLGTNADTLAKLKIRLRKDNMLGDAYEFVPLPYGEVDEIISVDLLQILRNKNFHFIWISLGAPKQDYAAAMIQAEVPQAIVAGVGLVFDYLAGNVQQPPKFLTDNGLEWLYRIFTQTRRTKHFIRPFFTMLFFYALKLGTLSK